MNFKYCFCYVVSVLDLGYVPPARASNFIDNYPLQNGNNARVIFLCFLTTHFIILYISILPYSYPTDGTQIFFFLGVTFSISFLPLVSFSLRGKFTSSFYPSHIIYPLYLPCTFLFHYGTIPLTGGKKWYTTRRPSYGPSVVVG